MNWKIAAGGMAAVVALLLAMSAASAVWGVISDGIHVSIPGTSEIKNVMMYVGQWSGENLLVQEIPGTLACPYGQVIKRRLGLPGAENVVIRFDNATLSNVKMYAVGLFSPSGTLENVQMNVDPNTYLQQHIKNAYMENLDTDIYFVQIGSLVYQGLRIYFE